MRAFCIACKSDVSGGSPPEAFSLRYMGRYDDGFLRIARYCNTCDRPLTVLPERWMPGAREIRKNQRIAQAKWRKKHASKT